MNKFIGTIERRQDGEVRDKCDRPGLISELLRCCLGWQTSRLVVLVQFLPYALLDKMG